MTHDELSASRLLCADVLTVAVEPDGASAALSTATTTLSVGDVEVGLWEAGPGTDVDTEVDEVFLVLSGAGTVTFADGSAIACSPASWCACRRATAPRGRSPNGSESCTSPDPMASGVLPKPPDVQHDGPWEERA